MADDKPIFPYVPPNELALLVEAMGAPRPAAAYGNAGGRGDACSTIPAPASRSACQGSSRRPAATG